jgi:hypothetical protein
MLWSYRFSERELFLTLERNNVQFSRNLIAGRNPRQMRILYVSQRATVHVRKYSIVLRFFV